MAVRQFAIPLDDDSLQTGDITIKKLDENNAAVDFVLSNVSAASGTNELNLITKKSGATKDHKFTLSFSTGSTVSASAQVTAAQIHTIYNDANGGDWDYVEAKWTLGATDTPITSVQTMVQDSRTYDYTGWPPKQV